MWFFCLLFWQLQLFFCALCKINYFLQHCLIFPVFDFRKSFRAFYVSGGWRHFRRKLIRAFSVSRGWRHFRWSLGDMGFIFYNIVWSSPFLTPGNRLGLLPFPVDDDVISGDPRGMGSISIISGFSACPLPAGVLARVDEGLWPFPPPPRTILKLEKKH